MAKYKYNTQARQQKTERMSKVSPTACVQQLLHLVWYLGTYPRHKTRELPLIILEHKQTDRAPRYSTTPSNTYCTRYCTFEKKKKKAHLTVVVLSLALSYTNIH